MRHFFRLTRNGDRIALIIVAIAVAMLGLTSVSAFGAPTTTTTLSTQTVYAGGLYAARLLDRQPVPPKTRLVMELPTPIPPVGGLGVGEGVHTVYTEYLLPTSVNVDSYVEARLSKGESVDTGTGTSPNSNPVYSLNYTPKCVSPHITFCGIYYSTTEAKNGEQELRIEAQVLWLPIVHVTMPTTGTVTVTAYGTTSLVRGSSDPSSVVLSHHQVIELRAAISDLKDMAAHAVCMEDSALLVIKVTLRDKVVWRAIGDECPGVLGITSTTGDHALDNRSCSFWHVVNSFFPAGTATATKRDSASVCSDTQNG